MAILHSSCARARAVARSGRSASKSRLPCTRNQRATVLLARDLLPTSTLAGASDSAAVTGAPGTSNAAAPPSGTAVDAAVKPVAPGRAGISRDREPQYRRGDAAGDAQDAQRTLHGVYPIEVGFSMYCCTLTFLAVAIPDRQRAAIQPSLARSYHCSGATPAALGLREARRSPCACSPCADGPERRAGHTSWSTWVPPQIMATRGRHTKREGCALTLSRSNARTPRAGDLVDHAKSSVRSFPPSRSWRRIERSPAFALTCREPATGSRSRGRS